MPIIIDEGDWWIETVRETWASGGPGLVYNNTINLIRTGRLVSISTAQWASVTEMRSVLVRDPTTGTLPPHGTVVSQLLIRTFQVSAGAATGEIQITVIMRK